MRRLISAVGGAAAVAACAVGLLHLGPGEQPGAAASPALGGSSAAVRTTSTGGAVGTARAAAERYPDNPVAWSQLARAEIETARTTLDAGRLEAAATALRRSLTLQATDNYGAVTGQGMLANARHEFSEGRAYGLRSTRMAPDRPDGYAVLADAEIQLGHYPAARQAVQRLLDLAPGTAAYSRAAYDLETDGRPQDAAIALRRAVNSAATPEEEAFAESRLGELAWSTGDVPISERHFRRASAVVPGHPYAEAGLARVHAARGRTVEALEIYDRLTERTPLPQFLLEAAELRMSAGAAQRPAAPREFAALHAQVQMLRAGGPVDTHLALYEADFGDPAVAVELMRREGNRSRNVIVADALGWALHRAGRHAEALSYARQAARTGWDNALFRYHRGAIEHALGLPEAHKHLREALTLNPHFSPYHAPRAAGLLSGSRTSS